MTVEELNEKQLAQLKQAYMTETMEEKGEPISYGDLADVAGISNDVIFDYYRGVNFTEDDFF